MLAKYPHVTVVTLDGEGDSRLVSKALAALQAAGASSDECMQFVLEALRTDSDAHQICGQWVRVLRGYTGTVHFTSSDPGDVLPADSTLTNGMAIFAVTLKNPGGRFISVADTVATAPSINSSKFILALGLPVTGFTTTVDGFTATFSKPSEVS
jgi:hypothetical protein